MLTSATKDEFTAFQTTYGYSVASDARPLLALSLAFLKTLPWCDKDQGDDDLIKSAQLFIAYAMSAEGGSFDPTARTSGVTVSKEEVDVLEIEYKVNESLPEANDSLGLLKSFPMIYALIAPLLCETPADDSHIASVFVA